MSDYINFKCNHFVEADRKNPDQREAVAYADVTGHTADDEQPGAVICRIWMMRDQYASSIYNKFKFIVDWRDNSYCMDRDMQELIRQGKEDLKKFFTDNVVEKVFKSAYRKYKVRWLLENNHPLEELMAKVQEQVNKDAGKVDTAYSVMKAFEKFEKDGCFANGLLWSDPDIFRIEEWENEDYMRELLSNEEYSVWKDR